MINIHPRAPRFIFLYLLYLIIIIVALGIDDSYNYCNYYWAGPRRPDPEKLRCVLIMLAIFIIVILNYNNYNTYKSQSPQYI